MMLLASLVTRRRLTPRPARWLCALAIASALGAAPASTLAAEPAEPAATGELKSLVETLKDDSRRNDLIAKIEALIALRQQSEVEEERVSLGARGLAVLSTIMQDASLQMAAAADALQDLPVLAGWFERQVRDADAREMWLSLIAKLVAIFAAGAVAEIVVRWALRHPRALVENRNADGIVVRVVLLILRTLIDLVPMAAFAAVAYGVMPLVQSGPNAQVVALTLVNAYLVVRGIMVLARMILSPAVPTLRLLPIGDETANYLHIWARRFAALGVFGYFVASAVLVLGLPPAGHVGLLRLVGFVIAVMAVIFILQNRRMVADWLEGVGGPRLAHVGGRLRRRLAEIWHVLAILYVLGMFAAWAVGLQGGFAFIVRATVVSALILVAARFAIIGLGRAIDRGFAINDDMKARFPTLESRANRYLPVLHYAVRAVVIVIATLALLQIWGIDAIGWLETAAGQRILGSAFSIALVLIVAFVVWVTASTAIERYLTQSDTDGNTIERSARARTLLPLLRNFLMVLLAIMVSLIVLSELGVDIGPLLAGAGVVGLAIGFGSQKLVQDVINGMFILFEDAISVGDVVNVAGNAGVVEALSIRTIRLRDLSGSVHTIPFSAVDTVTNLTKDFSHYVLDVGVAYRENTDEVVEVLRAISAEMEADAEYGQFFMEPIEILGVDQFADSAVVIKARLKIRPPIKRWFVGREFNRRMKKRFDELGIEIPFPHTTVYFGIDKSGGAPPAQVRLQKIQDQEGTADGGTAKPAAEPGDRPENDTGQKS